MLLIQNIMLVFWYCRDEIEQLFWHDDQAGKIVNPEAFINSKVTILEDKNKKLQQDLDRTKVSHLDLPFWCWLKVPPCPLRFDMEYCRLTWRKRKSC